MNLAIICGSGFLPLVAIQEALNKNISTCVYYGIEEYPSKKEYEALHLAGVKKIVGLHLLQFGKLLKSLKQDKISHALLIGKIHKENLFKKLKIDLKTVVLMKNMINQNDSTFFKVIQNEFHKIDVEVLSQKFLLSSLLLPKKIYSNQKPSKSKLQDIQYGLEQASKIAKLDIGQTIIVKKKTILAVEAIEGTDLCIQRMQPYNQRSKAIVCKVARPKQDDRFDVPTIGIQTINSMKQGGCDTLAIESDSVFVVDLPSVLNKINKYKMVFGSF